MDARRAAASRIATAALLSAPRIVSPALTQPPSTHTGSTVPSCGTVSRCAQSRTERSGSRPATRVRRLPVSSGSTSSPIPRSSSPTRAATAASSPETERMRHSSANWSFSRRRSTSVAGRICGSARLARPRTPQRRTDELPEQRSRALGPGLELGVVLRGDEERVVLEFDDLDQPLVGRRARSDQARGLQPRTQADVDLVAVAVALVDDALVVIERTRARARVELDGVGPEPHRPAEVGDLLLLGQQVDDGVRRLGVELCRIGAVHLRHVARELADGDLHPQADPEVGDPALAGDLRGADLALD